MRRRIHDLYHFLPVQLFLLHLRKYQLLLVFWLVTITTITGNFAAHFGAASLFLAPEYFGRISFASMLLLGGAMGVFVMSWHITTFIIHSKRMPFIGATRHAFLKYCINNSVIPLGFLVFYSVLSVRFQAVEEHTGAGRLLLLQGGFYLGFLLMIFISFAYFFRVGRDLLKQVIATITNPAQLRAIIPYDSLDQEFYMIRAETYIGERLQIEHIKNLEQYHPRLLNTVLRRHHRNAIAATVFSLVFLLVAGTFMEQPILRIPAGAGFLILFSVMMSVVGAVKYFLRSWEVIGWVLMTLVTSWMVSHQLFDLRSIAYGLNYRNKTSERPAYDYEHLKTLFTPQRYDADVATGIQTLNAWKARNAGTDTGKKPPLVVIAVSGGGMRAAYFSFLTLQALDSASGGALFRHTALITGASGGMIGASYWRALHDLHAQGKLPNPYQQRFAANISRDVLNAIIFSFAAVDLISPFNKISIGGYTYTKDRGYAMEQELIANTEGVLDTRVSDYRAREAAGLIPTLVFNSTIINDGRKLLISAQPVSYLTQPAYARNMAEPPIDGVDFGAFFAGQDATNLRTTSAIRMNATFPFILPVVKLPGNPAMNVMDAGLRDNFGMETATRWLYVFKDWLRDNTREVIVLQIRDTREYEVFPPTAQSTLGAMVAQPMTTIENKWEPFQSYNQSYMKDYVPAFLGGKVRFVTLQYQPDKKEKAAALNFHLTQREKAGIAAALRLPGNVVGMGIVDSLIR